MPVISSISNPRVADARKLHRKSYRAETGRFLIEGCRSVTTALRSSGEIAEVFLDPRATACADEVSTLSADKGIRITEVTDRVLKAVAGTTTPQGVVAVGIRPQVELDAVLSDASLVLVGVGIADPGNAGTLIRSAIAAGCDAVLFAGDAVDPFGPKTVRAAAGTIFDIPIATVGSLVAVVEALKARSLKVVGASPTAGTMITEVELVAPVALVVGNEAWGLGEDELALLDEVAAIPMPGPAESLNVGVAGSILLFEAVRQRAARQG